MKLALFVPVALFSLVLTSGCDKGGEAETKTDASKDEKADDAKKAEAKKAGDDAQTAGVAEKAPEAKHFDVGADQSGVLARTASVLETTDATAEDAALRGHLATLSHHAENLSSDQTLCEHMIELRKAEGQPEGELSSCVTHFEHEIVILGPEVFSQMAQCIMDAKSVAEIDVCEAAEKEAEELLHAKKHGDDLSEETCTEMYTKFEDLSVADAGEHGEFIREVLEEVKGDAVKACVDQGTQAEVDCVMKATNMDELSVCEGHEHQGEGEGEKVDAEGEQADAEKAAG